MVEKTPDRSLSPAGYLLLLSTAVLFTLGLLFIFNVSSAEALDWNAAQEFHGSLLKQLLFAAFGLGLTVPLFMVGVEYIRRHLDRIMLVLMAVLIACLIPGVGLQANGARRWIGIGGYYVQPSEWAKFLIPLYALKEFVGLQDKNQVTFFRVIRSYLWVLVPILLIMAEPDNRTSFLCATGVIVAVFLCGLPSRFWLLPMLLFLTLAVSVASQLPYVQRRIDIFLNPKQDLEGKGYQHYQSQIAAGSGELHGRGLGKGLQKFSYLPEAQNDYIVAIIGEELGFLGLMLLFACYTSLLLAGAYIALKAHDRFGQLAAGLLSYMLIIQAFVNLGVVGGLLPSTGLNLPFVSQGGSSLWACMMAVALLLDIDRS